MKIMTKRTFVIGDIHGGLKALLQVLNKLEVKEEDTLTFVAVLESDLDGVGDLLCVNVSALLCGR